jgi:hypothetical protein
MMTANVPVVPTRESLHVGQGAGPGVGGANAGHFVTRNAAPAGPPAFHQQAAQMEHVVQNSGKDISGSNGRLAGNESGRGQNGSPAFSRPNTTEATHNGNPGGNAQGNEASRGEWRSFGGNNAGQNSSHGPSGSPQGNSMPTTGKNDRPGWSTSGGGNTGKPQLQMAKPIVTPRSQAPAYTYSRPANTYSRPSSPPSQSYGNYNSRGNTPQNYGNSSRGNSSGSYSGRSSSPSYSGGRSSGNSGGSHSSSGGSHSSGGGGHSSSGGGGHSGGHH